MPAEGGEGQTSEDISEEMLAEASESMVTDSGEEAGETVGETIQDSQTENQAGMADTSERQGNAAAGISSSDCPSVV